MQVRVDDIEEAKREVMKRFEIPVEIHGRTMIIPAEIEVGENWRDLK